MINISYKHQLNSLNIYDLRNFCLKFKFNYSTQLVNQNTKLSTGDIERKSYIECQPIVLIIFTRQTLGASLNPSLSRLKLLIIVCSFLNEKY